MAEISVIIPVFNVEKYLARCLDSVISQSFEDIEIICVNDGSTDSSVEILESYSKFDNRIKVITKENGGLSSARNTGIKYVSGKYIYFLDSDDYISTVALELLYNNAEKYNSDMVICDYIFYDGGAGASSRVNILDASFVGNVFSKDSIPPLLYKFLPVQVSLKLYRADLINKTGGFQNIVFEDLPFFTSVFLKSQRVTYLNEPLFLYNSARPGAIMSNNDERLFDVFKAYDMVIGFLKAEGYYEKFKPAVQILIVLDIIKKFREIRADLKERFYNEAKLNNYNIDCSVYNKKDLSLVEQKWFRDYDALVKSLSYADYIRFLAEGI